MKKYALIALALIMAMCAVMTACAPQSEQGDEAKNTPNIITPAQTASSVTLSDQPLTMTAESVNAKVGEQFSIFVEIKGNSGYENWAALDVTLSYDPNLYSIDSIETTELTEGAYVDSNLNSENAQPGQVTIAVATPEDVEFGKVLELKCTALAAGEFTAEFSGERVYIYVIESDGSPNTIPAALQTDTFIVMITE